MSNPNPKISIITVVRNGEQYIQHAIQSILDQTYPNIEYVIIDGKSSDGTIKIIEKYASRIATWISESDNGIYDAMNKGVRLSSGDWVLFINSDDYLATPTVIEEAVTYLTDCNDLVAYGKVTYLYPHDSEIDVGEQWSKIKNRFRSVGMSMGHQAIFHSRKLFAQREFDTSFAICGDYDLLLSNLKSNDATYIPLVISRMRMEGVSSTASKFKLLSETRKAQRKNNVYPNLPSISWIKSSVRIVVVDFIIRKIGVQGKNRLKNLLKFNIK
ncbi:glycosyltransferase family 2 protein [Dyadobacter crusticola]|uniref:glycosyltransferase family 2 protein n=1 Tax=Dyadobacter crusticola TaxID=292407 RepID=UPI000689802C|nr:glycosyltransferase family 2 protein [Dyadobacter crusticola]